ncbi:hypothetical protein EMIHUDRAFT_422472, partial [Emiliania huxleyi CCMP1516]|uniref:Uncharacterized protein n=2 Tax=Emiliania huxleyi TaxID=2903 RepID=A0A0D3IBJ5_EMIH1
RGALPAPPPSVPAPLGEPLARRRCRDAGVAAAVPSVLRVAHSRRAAAHLARRPAAGPLARPASAKASCGARRPLVAPARQLGGARRRRGAARLAREQRRAGVEAAHRRRRVSRRGQRDVRRKLRRPATALHLPRLPGG